MKLRIGKTQFGHVPDEKVKDHKPKPIIRHEVVEAFVLDRVEELLKIYVRTDEQRARMLRAMRLHDYAEQLRSSMGEAVRPADKATTSAKPRRDGRRSR